MKLCHLFREVNRVMDLLANKTQMADFAILSNGILNLELGALLLADAYGINLNDKEDDTVHMFLHNEDQLW